MQVTKLKTANNETWYIAILKLSDGKQIAGYGTTHDKAIADLMRIKEKQSTSPNKIAPIRRKCLTCNNKK